MKYFYVFFLCSLLSGCQIKKQAVENEQESLVTQLDASAQIIMHLLQQKKLDRILEIDDSQKLQPLIINFSPAEIALESEILNCEQPVLLTFIHTQLPEYSSFHKMLEKLARKYEHEIKFVEIDTEKLFKIAEQFEIVYVPTINVVFRRNELTRLEKPNFQNLEDEIQSMIQIALKNSKSF